MRQMDLSGQDRPEAGRRVGAVTDQPEPRARPALGSLFTQSRDVMKPAPILLIAAWALVQIFHTPPALTVNPDPIVRGQPVDITYSGPQSLPVVVEIDNGGMLCDTVEISNNPTTWTVPDDPDWDLANFNAPGCYEVTVFITDPEELPPPEQLCIPEEEFLKHH